MFERGPGGRPARRSGGVGRRDAARPGVRQRTRRPPRHRRREADGHRLQDPGGGPTLDAADETASVLYALGAAQTYRRPVAVCATSGSGSAVRTSGRRTPRNSTGARGGSPGCARRWPATGSSRRPSRVRLGRHGACARRAAGPRPLHDGTSSAHREAAAPRERDDAAQLAAVSGERGEREQVVRPGSGRSSRRSRHRASLRVAAVADDIRPIAAATGIGHVPAKRHRPIGEPRYAPHRL